jgi:diadenylate cyclase
MDQMQQWLPLLFEIGLSGLLDILIVTLVIYTFLLVLKRTRRSGLIFTGIVIVGAIYLLARKLNLLLTVALLQGFFAVILVALIVIFQEDLRFFFERMAALWLERGLPGYKRRRSRLPRREVEILARTLGDLARGKIGALVVLRGKDSIARHLEGGADVDGLISEDLLKSIFDPHSLGHDGAVVIGAGRIEKLGCHLPLSTNFDRLPRSGTRHAAALGISERSDALGLAVSEEQGTISLSRQGELKPVSTASELASTLEAFYDEIDPPPKTRSWTEIFRTNYREKALSFGLAAVLWIVVGYGSQTVQRIFEVPVRYGALAGDLLVADITPGKVQVTFSGHRRAFTFIRPDDLKLELNLWDLKKGEHHIPVNTHALSFPPGMEVEDIEPRRVRLLIESKLQEKINNHKVPSDRTTFPPTKPPE